MPEIRLRHKRQVTLPASIVREANLNAGDRLEVTYTNGTIVLTPSPMASQAPNFDLMAWAGIGKGIWGNTAEEIAQYIDDLRK